MDIERFNVHSIDVYLRVKPVMCQLKVCDWFLRIALSTKSVCMCGFECVPAPGFLIENFYFAPQAAIYGTVSNDGPIKFFQLKD